MGTWERQLTWGHWGSVLRWWAGFRMGPERNWEELWDPCAEDAEGGKIWGDMGEGQEYSHRSHSREAGGRQDVLT